jgi:hypothetical protein
MVLDLAIKFHSKEMEKHRGKFARMLLKERDSIDLRRNTPVLEFFEEVGYMTRREVLDEGMVWNSFEWWFGFYYAAVKSDPDLVNQARKKSGASLFCEIDWLNDNLSRITRREERTRIVNHPSQEDIIEFLNEEIKFAG